jgi:hypothetical protein
MAKINKNSQRPIEVIDEHHEAYLCIENALKRGYLKKPFRLVHVDSHADLANPQPTGSCYRGDVREYVEKHINIGSYIIPLILRGLVDEVILVGTEDKRDKSIDIGSFKGKGRNITTNIPKRFKYAYPDRRRWRLKKTTDIRSIGDKYCVLDIDCDYFACNFRTNPPYKIPMNAAQRKKYNSYFRSGDRFGIKLNIFPWQQGPDFRTPVFNENRRWAEACVDHFTSNIRLRPALTIVCKSDKSGFTPHRLSDPIAKRLIEGLATEHFRPRYPMTLRPRFREETVLKGKTIHSALTGLASSKVTPAQLLILRGIRREKTLKQHIEIIRKTYKAAEDDATYNVLRYLFLLKRIFLVR